MKKGLKIFGILLVVVGLLAYFGSKGMEEAGRPSKVMFGYDVGNGFVKTDESYIGGLTSEGRSVVNMLEGVGIAACVGGGLMWLLSFAVREE